MNLPTVSSPQTHMVMVPSMPQVGAPGATAATSPLAVASKSKRFILTFAVLMTGAVTAILSFVQPHYTSSASVAIDARQVQLMGMEQGLLPQQITDETWTRTQMEVLNSPVLATQVVRRLHLMNYPEFDPCQPKLSDRLKGLFGIAPVACVPTELDAAKILLGKVVDFNNDRQSYVVRIEASTPDAQLSSNIANAYAQAYTGRQQDANRRMAAEADASLAGYLSEAKTRVVAAEDAVEDYRQRHHLVSIGGTNPIGSSTLQAQSLGEANTELSSAAAELAMKQSQLQQVQQLIRSGQPLTAIVPVLQSPVVQALVERQADADSTLNDLRTRLGDHHPDVAGAEARSQSIHAQLEAEVQKTVSSLSTEVAGLAARKGALTRRVGQFETVVNGQSEDDVKLSQLQREAQAEEAAYETINTKTKQIAAEQLVQRSAGQIVVEAIPSDVPSSPKKKMIIAGTFLASLGLGAWLAVLRKMMSPYFDGAEQVEAETGLPVLGLFKRNRSIMPQDLTLEDISNDDFENAHALIAQISSRIGRDPHAAGLVVLVTSSTPGEGKSSFANTLGHVAAQSGITAMLLDNDPANSFGTNSFGHGQKGPVSGQQVTKIYSPQEVLDLAETERSSGLRFLKLSRYFGSAKGVLAWSGLQEYLGRLRTQYQLTIVDVASVLATSDALRFGALSDRRILLIDPRKTTRKDVLDALNRMQRAGCPATATVLTEMSGGSQRTAKRALPKDVSLARSMQSSQLRQA